MCECEFGFNYQLFGIFQTYQKSIYKIVIPVHDRGIILQH